MKPVRLRLAKLLLFGILLLALAPPGALAAADKTNIIFLLSDDVAQGDLGCYGQKLIQTDLVAKAGSLMQAAHVDDSNWPMRDRKPGAPKKAEK